MGQRRRRPHPTRADQATTRPSNGARSTAIYNGTASPAPTPDQSRPAPTATTRPSNGARSTAIYNGTASPAPTPDPLTEPDLIQRRRRPHPTKQPPDPLTEPDLLRFTMGQRRRRPHPTSADQATTRPSNGARSAAIYNGTASPAPTPDQSRPAPTKQPPPDSNGARSTAIYKGTASPAPTPDQSRPAPTKQPPDPLTEPDLLRFTMGQRRRRPHPTRADQRRPSNHQTL